MSKIYIVKSSSGSYEDYSCWNEKAFTNRDEAEAYAKELDKQHFYKPQFITDDFERLIGECEDLIPEWEDSPYDLLTQKDKYLEWCDQNNARDTKLLINLMYERGQFMTEAMYDSYNDWHDNNYREWYNCEIEELELV